MSSGKTLIDHASNPVKSKLINGSTGSATGYGDLEDYIIELQSRSLQNGSTENDKNGINIGNSVNSVINGETNVDPTELLLQLAQKEKDLILAAELGKALLERNEQLTRANERITEEYSHKLESLEQEKHALRRKLDNLEGEYEGRVSEYQADLTALKKELNDQQNTLKQYEREKGKMVQELMEQNHRLTTELKQASESEEQLSNQLLSLREQFNARRSNLNDHVAQMEGLREEINLLSKRKSDLEKRISALHEEREQISLTLEESNERILMLEKTNQDQTITINNLQRELEEARVVNDQLKHKMDHYGSTTNTPNCNGTGNGGGQPTSLYNEIEMSSSSSIEDDLKSNLNLDEDICDYSKDLDENWKNGQELSELYHELRRMCQDLHRRRENSGHFNSTGDSGIPATPEDINCNHVRPGMISAAFKEYKQLLEEMDDLPCVSCQSIASERLQLEKMAKEAVEKDDEIKRKNDELMKMATQMTILETELKAVKEERDYLKESVDTDGVMGKDELVKRAWELRDQAVARKNAVEIELAKTRIECMHINSQLMEAIQQKITLSQQLEQWQVDMQSLLDEQLKNKLSSQEKEEKRRQAESRNLSPISASTPSLVNKTKLLRLFRTAN